MVSLTGKTPVSNAMAKRSYKDAFLDFGFTNIVDHGIIKPQCVICCEVLSNESLKSNKLKRHLTSKHPQHALQERAFFERKAALKRQRFETPDNPAVVALKQATLASYKVAWRVFGHSHAKAKPRNGSVNKVPGQKAGVGSTQSGRSMSIQGSDLIPGTSGMQDQLQEVSILSSSKASMVKNPSKSLVTPALLYLRDV
ncbi:SCAN domain-containing protein 3-like [Palaemon carinicauda]|uniref:SCAN domain-containing protein 3-like n=1 Tax=Palaemon carinicauda TaxID=392227 RepID=UPI0035B642EB